VKGSYYDIHFGNEGFKTIRRVRVPNIRGDHDEKKNQCRERPEQMAGNKKRSKKKVFLLRCKEETEEIGRREKRLNKNFMWRPRLAEGKAAHCLAELKGVSGSQKER